MSNGLRVGCLLSTDAVPHIQQNRKGTTKTTDPPRNRVLVPSLLPTVVMASRHTATDGTSATALFPAVAGRRDAPHWPRVFFVCYRLKSVELKTRAAPYPDQARPGAGNRCSTPDCRRP